MQGLRTACLALLLALLPAALPAWPGWSGGTAVAHTLGIDRTELMETAPATYRLVARVPPAVAPAIRAPDLPAGCRPSGPAAGTRDHGRVLPAMSGGRRVHVGGEIGWWVGGVMG